MKQTGANPLPVLIKTIIPDLLIANLPVEWLQEFSMILSSDSREIRFNLQVPAVSWSVHPISCIKTDKRS